MKYCYLPESLNSNLKDDKIDIVSTSDLRDRYCQFAKIAEVTKIAQIAKIAQITKIAKDCAKIEWIKIW